MENIYIHISGSTVLWVIFLCLILKIAQYTIFLPYRTTFATIWTKIFNKHYRASKKLYDEMVRLHERCRESTYSDAEGYNNFLQRLQDDDRFRSLDDTERLICGTSKNDIGSVDDILFNGGISQRDYESFVAFFGKGTNWHKVWIVFDLNYGSIHLQFIMLFYTEEVISFNFFHEIEKRSYPPDDLGRGKKRKNIPDPISTYA